MNVEVGDYVVLKEGPINSWEGPGVSIKTLLDHKYYNDHLKVEDVRIDEYETYPSYIDGRPMQVRRNKPIVELKITFPLTGYTMWIESRDCCKVDKETGRLIIA
jgi:hypothetical protein